MRPLLKGMTMTTDNFEYITNLTKTAMERHLEFINAYLEPSHGQPEIGTTELKLIVLSLQNALGTQMSINEALIEEVTELRKSRLGRIFNKK